MPLGFWGINFAFEILHIQKYQNFATTLFSFILSPCSCQAVRKKRGQKQFRVNSYSATSISGSFVSMQNCHQSVEHKPGVQTKEEITIVEKKRSRASYKLRVSKQFDYKRTNTTNIQWSDIRMRYWGTWPIIFWLACGSSTFCEHNLHQKKTCRQKLINAL